jgi:hypothetical protein
MPDYAGEPITIRVTDPVDSAGLPLTSANAAASITIYETDQSSVVVANTPMTWDVGADPFYEWSTTGLDPSDYWAQVFITPTGGQASWEWLRVELLAHPAITGSCGGPWVNPTDVRCLDGLDADDALLACQAATSMLYGASGRQFSGVCSDTVRPCAVNMVGVSGFAGAVGRCNDGSTWFAVGLDVLPEITWAGFGGPPSPGISGGILVHSTLELPGYPVISVDEVKIDGLVVTDFLIVDDRWLIRKDGRTWPFGQRLDRDAGEVGTWSVRYSWGVAPIPDGILAARVLACELGKSMTNDETCRLPQRLQNLTREGVTAVVMDPQANTGMDGAFGIYEIDHFIANANPNRITRTARVINVDLLGAVPRRVR